MGNFGVFRQHRNPRVTFAAFKYDSFYVVKPNYDPVFDCHAYS